MTEKLPKGWIKTTLREVCLPVTTIQPKDSPNNEFTYFDIGGIDNNENRIADTKIIAGRTAPSRARQEIKKDDILFSNVRTYLRKIARVERDYSNPVASTGFTVIRPVEGVSSEFLFFQILSEGFLQPLHSLQTGTSYPAVHNSDVFDQPIVLPPSLEQRRIAAKLKIALSGIINGEKAANRAIQKLKEHRTTTLQAAVTGELTVSWRKARLKKKKAMDETGEALLQRLQTARRACWEEAQVRRLRALGKLSKTDKWKLRYPEPNPPSIEDLPKLPEGWIWASLDQLSIVVRGASPRPAGDPRYFGGVIPWITVGSLTKDSKPYLNETSETLTEVGKKSSRYINAETLLLTNSGATLGVPKISRIAGCINDGVAALLSVDYPLKLYLYYFLAAQTEKLRKINQGAAQPNLNTNIIKSINVPVPPSTEQSEIIRKVEHHLSAADHLEESIRKQIELAQTTRRSLLHEAFTGRLVLQNPNDEPASVLLGRIQKEKGTKITKQKQSKQRLRLPKTERGDSMQSEIPSRESLSIAWKNIGGKTNARRLFDEAGYGSDHVTHFYEALRSSPEIRAAFERVAQEHQQPQKPAKQYKEKDIKSRGRFRLIGLWIEDFKNLKDYTVQFDTTYALDVLLGWNGTGKSNLFEALVIIFRDLNEWSQRNRWPEKAMNGYRLTYEIDEHLVEVTWQPDSMKRPELRSCPNTRKIEDKLRFEPIKREKLPLPRFIFGYYSGPTNRLAEHFLPMKQAHYIRLREAKSDDAETLAELLEQRRFFCAETHHAKYVLLAFSYKEDPNISEFLKNRLRILSFESALFVIRKPRWAKPGSKAENFWGATGIMRRVMERLRNYAIAPMVIEQNVNYGYRSTTEDHYYFFLPDLKSLHSFAAEYQDARTFFLALESTDFSELIHDVQIQVSIEATNKESVSITFHQLSEGEQQLLMVLGLMRFTKSHQSLVLLDEPDTHLNPHWSINYLKDLTQVMSDNSLESPEQQSSHILMATHDPLVIPSLVKEQIYLLKRNPQTGVCWWVPANINPRGLGFTGILTSEMFGFRSDLDEETLTDLDNKVRLMAKESDLNQAEKNQLEAIDKRLMETGFQKAFSDPYYAAFVRAWGRKYSDLMAGQQFQSDAQREEINRIAREVLDEARAEVDQNVGR
jgi:restriction endonuclease S subunit/predicted ATPase